jgi:hypothetical protein
LIPFYNLRYSCGDIHWAARGWTAARIHSVARIDVWRSTPDGLLVGGVAFAGTQGVSAVELRVNDGAWQQAELNIPALSQMSWVQWRIALALAPGAYTLTARMIDGQGQVQTPQSANVYPNGSTGACNGSTFLMHVDDHIRQALTCQRPLVFYRDKKWIFRRKEHNEKTTS